MRATYVKASRQTASSGNAQYRNYPAQCSTIGTDDGSRQTETLGRHTRRTRYTRTLAIETLSGAGTTTRPLDPTVLAETETRLRFFCGIILLLSKHCTEETHTHTHTRCSLTPAPEVFEEQLQPRVIPIFIAAHRRCSLPSSSASS